MGFKMGGVDHQLIRLTAFRDQLGQNPIEYAEPAPADEAIIEGRSVRNLIGSDPKKIKATGYNADLNKTTKPLVKKILLIF